MNHADRFTGRVQAYERYRMRYPAAQVLALLQQWCGLQPAWHIADVGAGTGMLAEIFLANGNPVVAVEPNAEMRAACLQLTATWPQLEVRDASAEHTGLATASQQMVAVGRAFHWFDQPRAVREFDRILGPDGWVVLVSLGRSLATTEQDEAYESLLLQHGTDYAYLRGGYRVHERLSEVFGEQPLHRAELRSQAQLTLEEFLGQAMSISVAPLPGHPRYEGMQQALYQHFARYAQAGVLTMSMSCWVTALQRNPRQAAAASPAPAAQC
ncbi:MAG: class I SAM-dependent methyltransferase [Acidobacteriota bacterium]|nr:class I SAM-dependent methyltransferase [Acidobacteriota bacterium]